jgi:predicted phosphodiesterase
MKRLAGVCAAVVVVASLAVWSRTDSPPRNDTEHGLRIRAEKVNPWNHLRLNNDPAVFRFAIVTDRTGGARAGIFERAVDQLNLLQPEFVVSVGDLIQGGSEELTKIDKQWNEFNGYIARLEMPFFYVPGNHDVQNKIMEQRWNTQFGKLAYHFLYRNVLFLVLNTEDPPKTKTGKLGAEQIAWAQKVLDENAGVRWTLVFLHRPVWAEKEIAATGWLEVEKALTGRKYTVFAGHRHVYKRFERNGARYYQLATTGGASKLRGRAVGEFDHLVWVTMKDAGPVLANLMMDGILPEDLSLPKIFQSEPMPEAK